MRSESARMSSAVEARFRINAPNSRPRTVTVIALDLPSDRVVRDLAGGSWNGATFLTASALSGAPRDAGAVGGWLSDLTGRTRNLVEETGSADLVVMVATAGEDAQAASWIGEACSLRRVTTTVLVLGGATTPDDAMSKTLAQVRPWALMVVIASAVECIEDMLRAFRA